MSEPQDHAGEPTADELVQEMARALAAAPVRDILFQTMGTFTDLAGVRLGYGPEREAHRDLGQARLAIEVLRALIAVADEELGAAQARPFREPLAQLQLLYARETEADAARQAGADADAAESAAGPEGSGLWTPGGDEPGDGSRIWTPSD
jgi:Domain of unknown function (DUF1844)